jgi:hypothetical protein
VDADGDANADTAHLLGIDAALGLLQATGARVTHSAPTALVSGAPQILAFDTERYDTAGLHDPVINNSRMTAVTAGLHHVGGSCSFAVVAGAGTCRLELRLNGATIPTPRVKPEWEGRENLTTLATATTGL